MKRKECGRILTRQYISKRKRNKAIVKLRKEGKTFQWIANKYGMSRGRIFQIVKGV